MRTRNKIIGLLLICLLTVGIASVYAQGGNPLDEVWSTITTIMNRIAALEARVDTLESIGPTFTVRVDYEIAEIWSYVTNPSLTIERGDEGPLHNVEVQYIRMTVHLLNEEPGETDWCIFYPDGDCEDYNGRFYFEGWELRWDSIVHPGETALVFWSGWGGPYPPGVCWQFTYELCAEYEGTTYMLTNIFEIAGVDP